MKEQPAQLHMLEREYPPHMADTKIAYLFLFSSRMHRQRNDSALQ